MSASALHHSVFAFMADLGPLKRNEILTDCPIASGQERTVKHFSASADVEALTLSAYPADDAGALDQSEAGRKVRTRTVPTAPRGPAVIKTGVSVPCTPFHVMSGPASRGVSEGQTTRTKAARPAAKMRAAKAA